MARPAFEPTDSQRKLVQNYATVGTRQEDIAQILDIDLKTLRKHFRQELTHGKINANAEVAKSLYTQCLGGNTTAMIFWLKTQAKWREMDEDKDDKDPPPLAMNFSVSPDIGDTVITRGEKRDE